MPTIDYGARKRSLILLVHDGLEPDAVRTVQTGLSEALSPDGWALAVYQVGNKDGALDSFRAYVHQYQLAGAVMMLDRPDGERFATACRATGTRTLRIGATEKEGEADWLHVPEREAVSACVDWLVTLGHRRIGFIGGPDTSRAAQLRELGYLDGIADHDLDRGASLNASGDFTFASGLESGRLLIEVSPRPTAIIACSDAMAAGVIHAAHQAGIAVPQQLSVIGFGDSPVAEQIWPPLTSIQFPLDRLARRAAQILTGQESGFDAAPVVWPRRMERGSTAPAPDAAQAGAASASSFQSG